MLKLGVQRNICCVLRRTTFVFKNDDLLISILAAGRYGSSSAFALFGQQRNKNYSCKMSKVVLAPTVKLNNGYEMPVLGLGTYKLKKTTCSNAIREALSLGYRHIDTAYLYRNESVIGKVLQEEIDAGKINREDIFLVSKLWNIHHEPQRVEYACKMQLEALGLDYIDLYLMHSSIAYKYVDDEALKPHVNDKLQTVDIDYVETYKAMEQLVDKGLVRSIGISNFNIAETERILRNCNIKPVTNQVECHPLHNQLLLIEFNRLHDIIITAYSPLVRPKATKPKLEFYDDKRLKTIAEKYSKTPAQVVLRYLIDIGTVPIPKAAKSQHLKENIEIFDFVLTEDEAKDDEGENAVKHAIDVGYRHIDTAYFYENESEVGKAICDKIDEGIVTREDIFLVTKLWNIHHDPERVEGACRKQLALLGLNYIDLYLMHLPVAYKYVDEESLLPKDENDILQLSDIDYLDTYKAMEQLVELGLVRSIGVSNFNSEQLKRVLDNCKIKPVTNQVECSPALNQKKLISYCKQHNITLTAYSPLGRPKPDEKTPEFVYSEKTQTIAEKYKKTPAQIVLRFLVEFGAIPIPKSSNPARIAENFNIFDFKLSSEDIAVMESFNTGDRLVPFNLIKSQNHKYYPFNIEY